MNERRTRILSLLLGFSLLAAFGITTDEIMRNVYDSTNTALRTNLVAGGGAAGLTVGTSTITGGSNAQLLYDNSGVLGERANPLALTFGGTAAASFTAARCVRVNAGGTALEAASADCGSGSGNVTAGTLTTGVIPKATGATAIGDGALVDNATSVVSIKTAGRGSQLANAAVTGTTTNKLAKQSSTGALIVATTDTGGVLGICDSGCGTTGDASIVDSGPASCVFDNSVIKGDLFSLSTSVAGDCTDIGTSVTGGVPILGTVTNANAAAGTRTVWFNGPDVANITNVKGGGGGGGTSVGSVGNVQVAAAAGKFAAYGGSGTCSAGQAITALDASGAKTCAAFGSGSGTVTSVAATVPGGFSIAGSPVTTSGTLAISANGTSGGIPYYSGATTMASSGALTANVLVKGGGAGGAPTTSSLTDNGTTVTGTESLLLGNGTQALPSHSFSADPTMGLYRGGTTEMYLTAGGTNHVNWELYESATLSLAALNNANAASASNMYIQASLAGGGNGQLALRLDGQAADDVEVIFHDNGHSIDQSWAMGIDDTASGAFKLSQQYTGTGYARVGTNDVLTIPGLAGGTSVYANGWTFTPTITGGALVTMAATGTDTNIAYTLTSKGSGNLNLTAGSTGTIAHTGAATFTSTITSSATTNIGWTPVAAANQACNTTCTSACVFGTDAVTGGILACTDATSDVCLCAGSS